jgi:hypothetical protein
MSLPADGNAHYTVKARAGHIRRYLFETPVRLDSLKGHRALLALGINSATLADADLRSFERNSQDAVAFLDLRAFPDVGVIWTELGVVEAWKTDQLQFNLDFEVSQLLLVTGVRPWVYFAAGVRREAITR